MTPQFPQQAQHVENKRLAYLLSFILAAVSLTLPVASASLAAVADCQFTEDSGSSQGIPAWKGDTSSIFPRSITVKGDIYRGFVSSPVLELALVNNGRFGWSNRENQEVATVGVCLSQDIRKSAFPNQALNASIGKVQAKVRTKIMKAFALPYDGKRQIHTIRMIPHEIGIPPRDKTPTIIGPVKEIEKSILSDERSVGQPFVGLNPFQNALQLPDNESSRMNRTTTQALHAGNCASGCS